VSEKQETWYDRVYAAKTVEETEAAYQGWAATYEADLYKAAYRGPAWGAAMLCRHVEPGDSPILEAAVGTGMVGDLLSGFGYENLVGIDLSDDMLAIARHKNLYSDLLRMRLGGALDFPDNHFAASLIVGAFTPGHAPPESMPELVRVTRPGAPIIFTLRVDGGAAEPFIALQNSLEEQGLWSQIEKTSPMNMMPLSEPDVFHRVFVYQVS
jgi:SAM-dependent methyltransferase